LSQNYKTENVEADSPWRQFIEKKLKENNYNISRTAEELGVYPSNLHGKIKKYNIKIER
jgi:two-component system nitrogen regulation response regulator NtrX